MKSIFLTFVYVAILYLGMQMPLIFVLGYVWVDIFVPQLVAYSILPSIPVSMIMAMFAVISLFFLPRDGSIKIRKITVLTLLLGIWMTLTLLWAELPAEAFVKWNWAIKSVLFACIVPFFLRRRVDFEAFLWTIVISGIAHCLPFGAKVLISGGGYGKQLGLVEVNYGYGEGSTLSMFAISLIPMCIHLYKWQTLIENKKLAKSMLSAFIVMALLTSFGTYARTGLVCMATLGALLLFESKHKIRNSVGIFILTSLLFLLSSDQWTSRMETIGDGTEGSAMGRVAVWLWTLDYIKSHPLGGGFEMYQINQISMELADGSLLTSSSKAFHSIYFEVLGETGIPGLILFLSIAFQTYRAYFRLAANRSLVNSEWRDDIGLRLRHAFLILLVGGAFIGIGFQSYFYYFSAIAVALINLDNRFDDKS